MSDGEPGSIKRISPGAAGCVFSCMFGCIIIIFLGDGLLYQALYRKWRPKVFEDVAGQPNITAALKNEVMAGRIAHAYIFTGSRGTGKTTCAKILAKAVNCLDPHGGDPCNECENCRGIDSGSLLDVVEIDAASNNGVDNIRELREETVYTPASAKYRVYIIDEAHMLSTGAFNALLKTLEEPPAYVIFILATTEVHKIPATVMSRCQRFDFRRIPEKDIVERLLYVAEREKIDCTGEAAEMIARLSDGALRDALSLLDQCAGSGPVDEKSVAEAAGLTGRDYLFELSDAIKNHDSAAAFRVIDGLYASAKDVERLCEELIAHFRDLMVVKTVKNPFDIVACRGDERVRLENTAAGFSVESILYALDALQAALDTLRRSASGRVGMESCLLRLCNPQLDTSAAALLARIEELEEKAAGGAFIPSAVPAGPAGFDSPESGKEARTQPAPPFGVSGAARSNGPQGAGSEPAELIEQPAVPQAAPADTGGSAESADFASGTLPPKEGLPSPDPSADVPLDSWAEVLETLKKRDAPLYGVLRESSAIIRGGFVLIDPNNQLFAGLIKSQDHQRPLVEAVRRVTGRQYKVGIFKKGLEVKKAPADELDELLDNASRAGIDVREQ